MLERDVAQLRPKGVDLVFAPSREEMYPAGHGTTVQVSDDVTSRWEGAIRPGHFDGVATVVLKLFHAAQPDAAYFGQKDYQQCAVIRRMIRDLNVPIEMRVCPTVRDADGLALSSRNAYLTPDERLRALSLSKALNVVREQFAAGERNAERLVEVMLGLLRAAPIDVDYAAIVDPHTLAPVTEAKKGSVVLVAARLPSARLIDNCIL
jgi:pantoate--beta-alanine ligase